MTYVAWPERSVRPYESLLILVLRFLWLNRPEPSEFAQSLQVSPYQLIRLDLVFRKVGKLRVELPLLQRLLQMNDRQWSRAKLDWVTLGYQTYPGARFCPKCLEYGYHAAIFQLRSISVCPEHRCELICGCPGCGAEITTVLTRDLHRTPITCLQCGKILVDPRVLIDPPTLGPLAEIARVAEWYRWAAEWPRLETLPQPEEEIGKEIVNPPLWTLMELAGGKRAPELVNLDRERMAGSSARVVTCGLRVAPGDRAHDDPSCADLFDKEMRCFALYRLYRRYLRRTMGSSERRLFRDFARLYGDRWDRPVRMRTSDASHEATTRAFAQVLFQFTMEGPRGLAMEGAVTLIGPVPLRAPVFYGDGVSCASALSHASSLYPYFRNLFCCSPAERQWIEDHLVFEGMRSVFEDAVRRAREMVRTGYYFLVDLCQFQRFSFPYCLGMLDGQERLKLWTLKLAVDPSDYRRVQEGWMTSPTARILYKERGAVSDGRDLVAVNSVRPGGDKSGRDVSVPGKTPADERVRP